MNYHLYAVLEQRVLEFCHIITTPEQRDSIEYRDLYKGLLKEESDETDIAGNRIEILDGYCDQLVILIQLLQSPQLSSTDHKNYIDRIDSLMQRALKEGYSLFEAMLEVCRSNMTKVPTVDELKQYHGKFFMEGAVRYIMETSKFTNVYGSYVVDCEGVARVVFKGDLPHVKDKVAKPITYIEPDLRGYV